MSEEVLAVRGERDWQLARSGFAGSPPTVTVSAHSSRLSLTGTSAAPLCYRTTRTWALDRRSSLRRDRRATSPFELHDFSHEHLFALNDRRRTSRWLNVLCLLIAPPSSSPASSPADMHKSSAAHSSPCLLAQSVSCKRPSAVLIRRWRRARMWRATSVFFGRPTDLDLALLCAVLRSCHCSAGSWRWLRSTSHPHSLPFVTVPPADDRLRRASINALCCHRPVSLVAWHGRTGASAAAAAEGEGQGGH